MLSGPLGLEKAHLFTRRFNRRISGLTGMVGDRAGHLTVPGPLLFTDSRRTVEGTVRDLRGLFLGQPRGHT